MSDQPNAQISRGIYIEDQNELPWPVYELEDWWLYEILGYPRRLDSEGMDEYLTAYLEFKEKNPVPAELITIHSTDYSEERILAIPGVTITAYEGGPEELTAEYFLAGMEQEGKFIDFCMKHLKMEEPDIKWYLTAYYG